MSLPVERLQFPPDRRNGLPRRRDEPTGLGEPYRPDDRRLGLGRRWEDWCRPAAGEGKPDAR